MKAIVTFTLNPALDKNSQISRVIPEHKLRCNCPTFEPGGGGINVSRAINRLGGNSMAYWTCGGPVGDQLSQLLDDEQVDHQPIAISQMTRENLNIYETDTRRQFRFGMPGAKLGTTEKALCLKKIRNLNPSEIGYLVLSGSLPPGADDEYVCKLIDVCPSGIQIVFDPSGEGTGIVPRQPVFIVKPNLRELGKLSGSEVSHDREIRDASRSLIDRGLTEIVLTSLGSAGVVLVTQHEEYVIRAPTVPINSKVGAGDSTIAGLVLGLSRGRDLLQAVKYGIAAGAAAVMTPGSELCRRRDTDQLFMEMSNASAA